MYPAEQPLGMTRPISPRSESMSTSYSSCPHPLVLQAGDNAVRGKPIPRYERKPLWSSASFLATANTETEMERQSARGHARGARPWSATPENSINSEVRLVKPRPRIAVVDDDESVRESLPDLLRELGYEALAFASAQEFLDSGCLAQLDGLILDVAMPGMSGPELQHELGRRGETVPIIFITAQGDRSIRTTLREKGAIEVLFKPYSEQELREALDLALPRP